MRVQHLFAAVLTCHKAGDQVHGARPVKGVERNQVLKPGGLGVLEHALHAPAFKLEHRLGLALGKQLVDPGIVQRQVLKGKILLAGVARADQLARHLQNGQCGQAQKVKFDQANGLNIVLVVLAHG